MAEAQALLHGGALGLVVGLVLALTGAGGSLLAVPLLMAGLGFSLAQATPVGLLSVALSAVVGTALAWRLGLVRWRAALLMAGWGWLMAPAGAALALHVSAGWLTVLFAAVVSIAALRLWRQAAQDPLEDAVLGAATLGPREAGALPVCPTHPTTGRILWNQRCAWVLSGVGALSGLLSGLIGVGGGFLIVPALRTVSPLSIHSAAATSLMAVALISSGALLARLLHGETLALAVAAPFVTGALLGMLAGRGVSQRLAGPSLQRGFALLLLLVAAWMLQRALSSLFT